MLLIPTYLAPSRTHGIGLYVAETISAGTIVSIWDPEVDISVGPVLLTAFPETSRRWLCHYGYVDASGIYRLASGQERYINHSREPNVGGDPTTFRVALREIRKGEEILENYLVHEPELIAHWA